MIYVKLPKFDIDYHPKIFNMFKYEGFKKEFH